MFFEQNQVEANIGVARFLALSGRAAGVPEVFADRQRRGREALATLERGLDGRDFLLGTPTRSPTSRSTATSTSPTTPACPLAEHPAVAALGAAGGGPPRIRGGPHADACSREQAHPLATTRGSGRVCGRICSSCVLARFAAASVGAVNGTSWRHFVPAGGRTRLIR